MNDIAVIDILVPPPVLLEVVTGEKGDPGPPGPPGIPGPHAASHHAGGGDPVDVTDLAGYPGTAATFLRGDQTFAVPPAGDTLPMAPLGQVLSSQGAATPPVFRPDVLLVNTASALVNQRAWRLHVATSGDLLLQQCDDAGNLRNPRVGIDPYNGGFYTIFGGMAALNGAIAASWFSPAAHTFAECMAPAFAGRNVTGNLVTISDSTTQTPGAVIAGGGPFNVLARWNGTNWMVIGA
jgi:hypothetical protein